MKDVSIYNLPCRVQGSGFRVQGSGFRVQGSVFRVQGSGFRVQGSGFRVQDSGFTNDGNAAPHAAHSPDRNANAWELRV